jgi:hypothetical protein
VKYIYISPALIGARLQRSDGPGPVIVNVNGREHHTHCAEILGPDGEVIASVRFKPRGSPFRRIHAWVESEAPIRLGQRIV